jgi:hypothetical protein
VSFVDSAEQHLDVRRFVEMVSGSPISRRLGRALLVLGKLFISNEPVSAGFNRSSWLLTYSPDASNAQNQHGCAVTGEKIEVIPGRGGRQRHRVSQAGPRPTELQLMASKMPIVDTMRHFWLT